MKHLYIFLTFLNVIIADFSKAQIINTIAGGFNGDGSVATSIGINPQNQVVDASGNVFIADPDKHLVRKLSVNGIFSTVAGTGIFGFSGDGGPATQAQLKNPYNIAIDAAGNLFIADSYDNRIRKVATNGIITTIAGNGNSGFSGDGGPAISAELNGPNALAVDNAGNIFIADFSNNRVRKVAANRIITTVAGTGNQGSGGDGGPATMAQFFFPIGVAVNTAGEIFISDLGSNKIRKVAANGIISTVAGNGTSGFSGDGGLATAAQFNHIEGSVAIDATGNIFIPDSRNNRVRKVDINGRVTTIAGNGGSGFSGDGSAASGAELNNPTGVTIDISGNLYISSNYRVRKVTGGIINTVAGNGSPSFSGENVPATSAQLYHPIGVVADKPGNIFIAEGNRIRKVTVNGIISTVAGNGSNGITGDGGPATSAPLNLPTSLAVDTPGNIFIATNNSIRKVTSNGIITTITGNGAIGFGGDNGPATSAQFNVIAAIALDASGNIFIADRYNARIRKIDASGIIKTVAGNGTLGFSGDGGPAVSAQLGICTGLAVDLSGNIFIADGNNRIRKVDTGGIITTVAGNDNIGFGGDGGPATSALLNYPYAVAVDTLGNMFIADNNRIRKINPSGIISTVAGGGAVYGDGGIATAADISTASSIAVDASGNIFVTDFDNHRVRKISSSALPLTLLGLKARQYNNSIITTWQTVNEVNTASFEVQRSTDGYTFTSIGVVTASGNSRYTRDYSYIDTGIDQLNIGTFFYRLKMIDKDGSITYSGIVTVAFTNQGFAFHLSPNPSTSIVYIKGESIKQIIIADQAGKTLIQQRINNNVSSINVSGLPKGIYVVKAYNVEGNVQTRKMIVQ